MLSKLYRKPYLGDHKRKTGTGAGLQATPFTPLPFRLVNLLNKGDPLGRGD